MKKLSTLLFSAALLCAINSSAQINKGAVFLGGDIGVSSTKSTSTINSPNSYRQTGISISHVFGKAIKRNLIAGVDLRYIYSNVDNTGSANNTRDKTYAGGFFLRKYKTLGKSDFLVFLQGRFGVGYNTRVQNYNISDKNEYKQYSIGTNIYPGISYAVSKRLQIETGLNNLVNISYSHGKGEISGSTTGSFTQNNFSIYSSLNNFSSNLYLGFRILLNK